MGQMGQTGGTASVLPGPDALGETVGGGGGKKGGAGGVLVNYEVLLTETKGDSMR
jgi:hypothetical protein